VGVAVLADAAPAAGVKVGCPLAKQPQADMLTSAADSSTKIKIINTRPGTRRLFGIRPLPIGKKVNLFQHNTRSEHCQRTRLERR
jgi:hypothetical protein